MAPRHARDERPPRGAGTLYRMATAIRRLVDEARPRAKILDRATRAAAAMLAKVERAGEAEAFAAYAARVLDRREEEGMRDVEGDRGRLRQHIEGDPLGALAVDRATPADVRAWLARMLTKSATKGARLVDAPLAIQTVQNALNVVRVVFERAKDEGIVTDNPAARVAIPRALKRARPPRAWTVLSKAELAALEAAAPEDLRDRVVVASRTGLRLSELQHLRWSDVHMIGDARDARAFVLVARASAKGPTKNGKTRRVPLLPEALAVLARRQLGQTPGALVFGSPRGGARSKTGYRTAWARALRAAGVPDRGGLGFHVLRHTCATALLAGWWGAPWPIAAVAKMLGHSSVTVTERYAHTLDGTLFDLVQTARVNEIPSVPGEALSSAPVSPRVDGEKDQASRAHTEASHKPEAERDAIETEQTRANGRTTDHAMTTRPDGESAGTSSRLGDLNPGPTVYETGAAAYCRACGYSRAQHADDVRGFCGACDAFRPAGWTPPSDEASIAAARPVADGTPDAERCPSAAVLTPSLGQIACWAFRSVAISATAWPNLNAETREAYEAAARAVLDASARRARVEEMREALAAPACAACGGAGDLPMFNVKRNRWEVRACPACGKA